jgi:hypothetical protein
VRVRPYGGPKGWTWERDTIKPEANRRDGLMTRFWVDIALPDLLVALAQWERRADYSTHCGAR